MNTPSHDALAERARQIWQKYGCPSGRDTEIWLEAERELATKPAKSNSTTERLKAETAAESMVENHISPAIPDDEAIKASVQKRDARAPMEPRKKAPKSKPPESGKPLWKKAHSA